MQISRRGTIALKSAVIFSTLLFLISSIPFHGPEQAFPGNFNKNSAAPINGGRTFLNDTFSSPVGISYDHEDGLVYVSNAGSDNISIVNPETNMVTGSINTNGSPGQLGFSSNGTLLYTVTAAKPNFLIGLNLTVIDLNTGKQVWRMPAYSYPDDFAVNVSSGDIFLAGKDNVTAISPAGFQTLWRTVLPSNLSKSYFFFPPQLLYSGSTARLVANYQGYTLAINAANGHILGKVSYGYAYSQGLLAHNGHQLIIVASGYLASYNVTTLSRLWFHKSFYSGVDPEFLNIASYDSKTGMVAYSNPGQQFVEMVNSTTGEEISLLTFPFPNYTAVSITFDRTNGLFYGCEIPVSPNGVFSLTSSGGRVFSLNYAGPYAPKTPNNAGMDIVIPSLLIAAVALAAFSAYFVISENRKKKH